MKHRNLAASIAVTAIASLVAVPVAHAAPAPQLTKTTVTNNCSWNGYNHRGTASLSVTYSYDTRNKVLRLESWRINNRGQYWVNGKWILIPNAAYLITAGSNITAAGKTSSTGVASGAPNIILSQSTRTVGARLQSPAGSGVCGTSVNPPSAWK